MSNVEDFVKRPRLFYYEEGVDAWCPVPDRLDGIIDLGLFMMNGEEINIRFRRIDMTDPEFNSLPEE